jgi:phosphoglycolate phosphatase
LTRPGLFFLHTDRNHIVHEPIEWVLFDFDGTLTPLTLDFEHLRARVEEIARDFGVDGALVSLKDHFILEMIYSLEATLGPRGLAFSHKALERLTELELHASKGKDLYPFARDVLATLRQRGVRSGIITRTSIAVIDQVFPDFADYVGPVVTREHTRLLKPHPAHVVLALEQLRLSPEQGLMVGDHPTDILAGKGAGARTVGVLTGRTTGETFQKAGVTFILDDIRGLLTL